MSESSYEGTRVGLFYSEDRLYDRGAIRSWS